MRESRNVEHRKGGSRVGGNGAELQQSSATQRKSQQQGQGQGEGKATELVIGGQDLRGVCMLAAIMMLLAASSIVVGSLLGEGGGAQEGVGRRNGRSTGAETAMTVEEEVASFKENLEAIEGLLKSLHKKFLEPWKVNQNVSVGVNDDGLGGMAMRVTSLQQGGSCGVMQVEVELAPLTEYELLVRGCKTRTIRATDQPLENFRACPFVDKVAGRSSEMLLWGCMMSPAVELADDSRVSKVPCIPDGREQAGGYQTVARFNSSDQKRGYRIGLLMSDGVSPGDTFHLQALCWRPVPAHPQGAAGSGGGGLPGCEHCFLNGVDEQDRGGWSCGLSHP